MFLLQVAVTTNDALVSSGLSGFLSSPFVLRTYYFLKIILIVYSAILFVATVLAVVNSFPRKSAKQIAESVENILAEGKSDEIKITASGWQEITKLAQAGQEASWRLAVIEADKFFDEVLRRLGYGGDTFAERLKQVHPTEVENIDEVWEAHRVRNSLSHDVNFKLTEGEAKKAVAAYERAMQNLEVI